MPSDSMEHRFPAPGTMGHPAADSPVPTLAAAAGEHVLRRHLHVHVPVGVDADPVGDGFHGPESLQEQAPWAEEAASLAGGQLQLSLEGAAQTFWGPHLLLHLAMSRWAPTQLYRRRPP